MDKLGKVIKGLECCSQMAGEVCRECPYANECEEEKGLLVGSAHLAADALSLLKTREPMEPIKTKYFTTLCGQCRHEIDKLAGDKFCPHCGRAVKWE